MYLFISGPQDRAEVQRDFILSLSGALYITICNKRSRKKPLLNSHSFVDTLFNMQTHRGYSLWWYSNFSQTWNLSRSNSRNFWRLQPTYINSSTCRHIRDTVCDGIQTFLRLETCFGAIHATFGGYNHSLNLYKKFNMHTHRGYCLWWYPDISQTCGVRAPPKTMSIAIIIIKP